MGTGGQGCVKRDGGPGKGKKKGEARNLLCSHMGSGYIGNQSGFY